MYQKQVIQVTLTNYSDATPGTHGHFSCNDHFQWVNKDSFNYEVAFCSNVPAIFLGYGSRPQFTVPAHGSIELELNPAAQPEADARYEYLIWGGDCVKKQILRDVHVIIAGP